MKHYFTISALVLLSLNLVACSTNTPPAGGFATQAPGTGTGPAIAQADMPEYCQNAAVTQFRATPDNIATDSAVTLTPYRSGDSADKPTGQQLELALDGQTKYFNVRGIEVKDAASRAGILRKGALLNFKSVQKDGKATAASLHAVAS